MTDDERTGYSSTAAGDRIAAVLSPVRAPERRRRGLFRRYKRNRRIRWLRLLAILVPLSFLAVISMVFGMVLAFAPQLGPLAQTLQTNYKNGLNSVILSDGPHSRVIGILTSKNRFFLPPERIPLIMDHAIVAIEDKRFYTEPGIDYRGIARAFIADVFHTGGGTQGGSTIAEQFVKNALGQQGHRTIFNKLKEAALAFQLWHLWPPEKILAEYLNTVYFGNGAYGVEAAARAYFGNDPSSNLYQCGRVPNYKDPSTLCVTNLTADEAALLAAMVVAPTSLAEFLVTQPAVVEARRNLALKDMYQQGYLTQAEYLADIQVSLPPAAAIQSPSEEATNRSAGYFIRWIEPELFAKYGTKLYSAGYTIHTTLDYSLQQAAQGVVDQVLPSGSGGPAAALVAIDNKTGEVKAMVGGYDFAKNQFNLATQAERQPGSAFKVFDLAVALNDGYTATKPRFLSAPYTYDGGVFGPFVVSNDERAYFGVPIPLGQALAVSDNSVFARMGLKVGTRNIATLAHDFGISTTISINPSMVIGGLHIGVTPLDMAHAYETVANQGQLTSGTLASAACAGGGTKAFNWEETEPAPNSCPGPVGVDFVTQDHVVIDKNALRTTQVFDPNLAQKEISMMRGVMTMGTGTAADIPGVKAWGKTGTTSSYIDAWFVGSTPPMGSVPSMTVAIWVGFPKSGSRSMAKSFGGKPVYGGTYPALIWRAYVERAIRIYKQEAAGINPNRPSPSGATTSTGATGATATSPTSGTTSTTGTTGATPLTNTGGATLATNTPAGATTPPSSPGSVTSGGGSSAPATTAPAAPNTPPSTPSTGATPPPTTSSGGVTAPGGGATAPVP
jgi:penicillin-binding protein 1A